MKTDELWCQALPAIFLSSAEEGGHREMSAESLALGGKGWTRTSAYAQICQIVQSVPLCASARTLDMSVSEKEAGVQGKWITTLWERVLAPGRV